MADTEYSDKQFLELIVKEIVDNPEDVRVDRQVDEMGVLLTLHVNPKDMGQVVGRQGSTAKAIRSLLKIVGVKNNARVNLKIEEPEGGRPASTRSSLGGRSSHRRETTYEKPNTDNQEGLDMSGTTVGKVIDDIKKDLEE